jgi:hypothetical protein
MSRAAAFKQSDITRALKGAQAAGMAVDRVEIGNDGRIVLSTGLAASPEASNDNPWDKVLPNGKNS